MRRHLHRFWGARSPAWTKDEIDEIEAASIVRAMNLHGDDWNLENWFRSAVSYESRLFIRQLRDWGSVSLDAELPGGSSTTLGEVTPSGAVPVDVQALSNIDLGLVLDRLEHEPLLWMRVHEVLGYDRWDLSRALGKSEREVRLILGSAIVTPEGSSQVCLSCRRPGDLSEDLLCPSCRLDSEFSTLPTRRVSRDGGTRTKRPWLQARR